MNIKSVNSELSIYKAQDNIKKPQAEANKKENLVQKQEDKLELSVDALNFKPILDKIKEGFYDNPDVLNEVAKRLSAEIDQA